MAVTTLRPTGAGSLTECAKSGTGGANWDRVDEVTADDAATYVYATGYQTDLYATSHSIPAGSTINSVRVYARYGTYTAGGDAWLQFNIKDTAGTYASGWKNTGLAWADADTGVLTTRSDAGAWTLADIDALEIGAFLLYDGEGQNTACTQIYVDVDFTEEGPPPGGNTTDFFKFFN